MHTTSPKTNPRHTLIACAAVAAVFWGPGAALAQDDSEVLAEELANPLAASSAYRSSETTTAKWVRREMVHNGS
jgi:hypothetical protein